MELLELLELLQASSSSSSSSLNIESERGRRGREEAVGSSPSEEQKLWLSEKCKPHQLTCAEVSV